MVLLLGRHINVSTCNNVSYLICMRFFSQMSQDVNGWTFTRRFSFCIFCVRRIQNVFIFIGNNILLLKYDVIRKGIKIICHLEITCRERRTIPAEQPLCVRRGCVGMVIHVTTASAPLVVSLLTACHCSAIRAWRRIKQ